VSHKPKPSPSLNISLVSGHSQILNKTEDWESGSLTTGKLIVI
jgi:hypothetical protein